MGIIITDFLKQKKLTVSADMQARKIIQTIKESRDSLLFLKEMGITTLPLSPEIKKFLPGQDLTPGKAEKSPLVPKNAQATPQSVPDHGKVMNLDANPVLEEICSDLEGCTRCTLHENRSRIITGQGEKTARLFIIEEQPAEAEETEGKCVAGAAGELLDKMLKAIGLERKDIYLSSIVKCRPENDRPPTPEEIDTCLPFLTRQIAAVRPVAIFTLGPLAARIMTGSKQPLFRIRGKFHDFHGTPLLPSFHPSYLLKNEEMKKASWIDLQMIRKKLTEPS